MRIAVTGGLGLVGRAVTARARAAGHELVVIDRSCRDALPRGVTFRVADVTRYAQLLSSIRDARR